MVARDRLVPIIVASPLFLQNLDTSVMATALPSIAESLKVPPLHLNLAITSYLLSLAVFLPISGWLADRFGAKRVFCLAIAFFSLGSALCGAANSLPELVLFRILQGLGGAMMVPVGRLILLRSVPPSQMISAMVWFTVPPVIGRMVGPLFGGAIVTLTSWRWIFLINIPFGVLAIFLALAFVEDMDGAAAPVPFDTKGFVLLALGLSALLGALETAGKAVVPIWVSLLVAGLGSLTLLLYYLHGRRQTHPIIDLSILRFRTFRTNVLGAAPLRIAIGASPFLLPLMLQLGFGLSPLASGLLTVATAIGGLGTRIVMKRVIHSVGFRHLLIGATVLTSFFYMSYSQFSPSTPHLLIFCTLMIGGLVNSMCMVALGALGFSEIPPTRMSHATVLSSMVQQLSVSFGVVLGASLVSAAAWWHGGDTAHVQAEDFSPAFVVVGMLTMLSLYSFLQLHPKEGAGLH
ncbi:drug resistance transporter, EmrB/QacA subfamily [Polaromonas sp. OV174]|uniref:MFS transporter n=1 Tax=Polaromonas sp. OV174 TaxID=1855300 RepID=UPI0008E32F1B|nr:MFS transporter [Polaromonas sp. OV174]SFB98168.1 drug resistance transporter, EmrB/QacA subfamily [Polaromonas sp. OV174]